MEVVQEDCGDGSMLCTDHPYKNNNTPGGICAVCLQEKLGKLVSSASFPITVFPSASSSSSSPSFRSDNFTNTTTTTSSIVPIIPSSVLSNTQNECHHHHHFKISKIPFFLTSRKKKKKETSSNSDHNNNAMIFKRSKSTVTPRRGMCFNNEIEEYDPHKRRFWSFRHFNKHLADKKLPPIKQASFPSSTGAGNMGSFSRSRKRSSKKEEAVVVEENDSPGQVSVGRKVSRSRSVGCGSRSFSGDFFERISTGFGDCTLRRVESQREGKSRSRRSVAGGEDSIKERVKCGGLFSGFMVTSSSSSSSSSSYWVSSSTEDNNNNATNNHVNLNVKPTAAGAAVAAVAGQLAHSRSKTWGWAFASPMRAFSKPTLAKRNVVSAANNKNVAPNLASIPSLLAVKS